MTTEEFNDWISHHRVRFSQFDTWLVKDGALAGKLETMFGELGDIPAMAAARASDALYRGSEKFSDSYNVSMHAVDVARIARRTIQPEDRRYLDPPDRSDTYRCGYCRDTKTPHVVVYGKSFIAWFAAQDPKPVRSYENQFGSGVAFDEQDQRWREAIETDRRLRYAFTGGAVRCVCRKPLDEPRQKRQDVMFDPSRMVIADPMDVEQLLKFCERLPAERQRAFSEF